MFNSLYNLKNGSIFVLYPAEAMALTAFFCSMNIASAMVEMYSQK